jgi:hypothetical protein
MDAIVSTTPSSAHRSPSKGAGNSARRHAPSNVDGRVDLTAVFREIDNAAASNSRVQAYEAMCRVRDYVDDKISAVTAYLVKSGG